MISLERLYERIEHNRDRAVELQKTLNSVPAIAPESEGDGESRKADLLIQCLEELEIRDIQK